MPLLFREDILKQLKEYGHVKNLDHRKMKAKLPNLWTADNLTMDLYLEVEGFVPVSELEQIEVKHNFEIIELKKQIAAFKKQADDKD